MEKWTVKENKGVLLGADKAKYVIESGVFWLALTSDKDTAERIVKAVNSYDAMYEALKSAKEAYDRLFEIGCPQYHVIPLYRDGYRALMKALAEGK